MNRRELPPGIDEPVFSEPWQAEAFALTVALHEKGDFFGEGCLTGQLRRLATATAMTDCELLRLANATIERVIHEQV